MGDAVCPSLVGILCVIQSARRHQDPTAFPGQHSAVPTPCDLGPLTLAFLLPAGSLTSVFVRLPCGGVGVSISLMCK